MLPQSPCKLKKHLAVGTVIDLLSSLTLHFAQDMETQMVALERNMSTISSASESVDSSLSARRGQLEKLNGAKKNLTKLQFIMDLPSRLQRCVRDESYEAAVEDFRKARRILRAVGSVSSFRGIQDEATIIMKRLAQVLSARLQQPALTPDILGGTTKLLLELDGNEGMLLKEYLTRRRRDLHEMLTSFPSSSSPFDADTADADGGGIPPSPEEPAVCDDDPSLPAAARDVANLGAVFAPMLMSLYTDWNHLFAADAPEPVLADATSSHEHPLDGDAKEVMILDALQELAGGYIEVCRRRLQEEKVEPEQLLQGVSKLVGALGELHELVPQAKLMQRATRAAETLAKRAMDVELQSLQDRLAESVAGTHGSGTSSTLQEQLHAASSGIALHVRDALASTAPLIVPLCDLLSLRPDGMAKHLVTRLNTAILSMAKISLQPTSHIDSVLARAGLCLHMVSTGVAQVPAMLKAQLAPHGLSGAALGFESISMVREMQFSADALLERFVEMQAQKLSLDVSTRIQTTDWLKCPAPHQITPFVDRTIRELRTMQMLAAQILPGDSARSMLPQGPFASTRSSAATLMQQTASHQPASSTAIHKDLQRMFARKISFSTTPSGGGSKTSVQGMLTHVTKLTLKTLVEEVRLKTFCREGFQQVQLDCAFLRWILPTNVDDEGAVLALLDEAIISCQERSLDPIALEFTQMEGICEAKRKECAI